jgi:type I restriction enzyme M protein
VLDEARHAAVEGCRAVTYLAAQAHWLLVRFPDAVFVTVPGLCAAPTIAEIAANDWSLTPGRYVGAAPPVVDDEDVEERLRQLREEFEALNEEARDLAQQIIASYGALV